MRPIEQFFQVSLLGLLVSGFLALACSGVLDWPTIVLTSGALVYRAIQIVRARELAQLSGNIANALTIAYIGFYPIDYVYLSREFIPATVHLICFLSVIRILSARSNRDYFFVKTLAFLELVAATLLTSSITFFLFLATFLVFGVATFACSEIRRSSQQRPPIAIPRTFHMRLAALTAVVTTAIILMTAGMFVLLPRTARAAFRSMVPEKYHITGFANEISLGQIGRLQQDSTAVMHIRIEGSSRLVPLKWRGGVLTQFDGRRWYNPPRPLHQIPVQKGLAILADDDQRRVPRRLLEYQVRMDSIDGDALFFTGIPQSVDINLPALYATADGAYRTGSVLNSTPQYYARSYRPEDRVAKPVSLPAESAARYLTLPVLDPRIAALAKELDPRAGDADRARAFENYLRTRFSYTTDLLQSAHSDPLAYFLFDRKAGHCEYFASALAVMLRTAHIPSRVVTGFQSGVYNPMTGWHVMRAADAHSWVEAWIPGQGWTTFDPTPPALTPSGKPMSTIALYLDAAETWWQQWVMDYDLEHQLFLASRFEQSTRHWKGFSLDRIITAWTEQFTRSAQMARNVFSIVGLLILLTGLLWYLGPHLLATLKRVRHLRRIRQGGAASSDAAILYLRMLEILRRRGFEKPGWLTPAEFARVLPDLPMTPLVAEFTSNYQLLRYAEDAAAGQRMLRLLEEIDLKR